MNEPFTSALHTRRQFLRTTILGGAVAWTVPLFLEKTFFALDALAADSAIQTPTGRDSTILVVLQLAGGNDGLNTIIPYGDDAYFAARPRISLAPDKTLKVTDRLAFHPGLKGLRGLYDEGAFSIVQGVGYPNPNRSHFRSTEIWATASDAQKTELHGWIGRYFDNCCKGSDPAPGVSITRQTPQAFAAARPRTISFSRPDQFRYMKEGAADPEAIDTFFRELNDSDENMAGSMASGASIGMIDGGGANGSDLDTAEYLRRTALDAQLSSDRIIAITKDKPSQVPYPKSALAANLNLVGRMIASRMPTRVYYVSQGGYDTHANQLGSHARLMQDLDEALTAFTADLRAQGNFDRVLLMTFSEFGRRVNENSSGGTDHGAAAPLFLLGGKLKPGFHGVAPKLTELKKGDLAYTTDFRSVYATILERWLGAPSSAILGKKFPTLGFL